MGSVNLQNIVKNYGNLEVVHSINAQIQEGEFIVLVGPSGCGKSTVLRMIAGLEEITSGDLVIDGKGMNDVAPKDRNIAMVFQSYALYPHMSVFDNMSFSLKLQKIPKPEIAEKVNEAAEILGLEKLLKRKPAELSGGQRQRVAMGRAIVRKPSVFLFDEPLSNLDAKLRIQMRIEIKKLHQKLKSTIIYVTHDQIEAMTLADRIVIMKDGYIEQVGRPMDLFHRPDNVFVAGFIGNPPMNLVNGTVVNSDAGLSVSLDDKVIIPLADAAERFSLQAGQSVILGIRPEDIHLADSPNTLPSFFKSEGVIDVSEPLGNETIAHFNVNGVLMLANVKSGDAVREGATIPIALDTSEIHLFDEKSKKSLRN